MIVILEGVDKAGKTTLAEKLKEELHWPIVHFGKPGPRPADEYIVFLKELKDKDVICDRFFVGQFVYGPLFRGSVGMTPVEVVTIERLCRKIGAVLIHVNPPYPVIGNRLVDLGDDMISATANVIAYDKFNAVIPSIKLRYKQTYLGNYSKDIFKVLANRVKEIRFEHSGNKAFSGIGTCVGKKIVFVGDSLNLRTTWEGFPFDGGPAAEYLQKCLNLSFIQETEVYITNSDRLQRQEVNDLIINGETQFIALGNTAYGRLKALGIKAELVPHPQYWSRFKHSDTAGYVLKLNIAKERANIYGLDFSRR